MQYIQKKAAIFAQVVCFCAVISGCLSTGESPPTGTSEPSGTQGTTEAVQKDTLILFTGSDWEPDSPLFMQNIFTPEVKDTIEKNFTVHIIDVPRNAKTGEEKRIQRNYLLFSQYSVTDVPFIVMQTPDQDTYAALPLAKDITSGAELLASLTLFAKNRETVVSARERIRGASGYEKAAAIDSFLNTVYYPESSRYDALRMQVPDLDPDDRSGLKGKYILITADMQAKRFIQKEDFTAAGDTYKAAAESGFLQPDAVQLAWYFAAYSYSMSGKIADEQIILYLNNAIKASPESGAVEQLKEFIKKLERR